MMEFGTFADQLNLAGVEACLVCECTHHRGTHVNCIKHWHCYMVLHI